MYESLYNHALIVHSNSIYNIPNVEKSKYPINWGMNNQSQCMERFL